MEEADLKNVIEDIDYLALGKNGSMILNILVGNHPADIASIIQGLLEEHRKYVFGLLDADSASDVIVELDDVTTEKLVAGLRHKRLSEIVDEMDSTLPTSSPSCRKMSRKRYSTPSTRRTLRK